MKLFFLVICSANRVSGKTNFLNFLPYWDRAENETLIFDYLRYFSFLFFLLQQFLGIFKLINDFIWIEHLTKTAETRPHNSLFKKCLRRKPIPSKIKVWWLMETCGDYGPFEKKVELPKFTEVIDKL